MVLKYRYLGKGITDSNGIAHMTEDAEGQTVTGYTGTGRGLTDIIASTDDSTAISDSSIQSETYEVMDCIFYDDGTIANHNDVWTKDSLVILTRYDEYTQFKVETGNNGNFYLRNLSPNTVIDFDFKQVEGNVGNGFFNIFADGNISIQWFSLSHILGNDSSYLNTWVKLRVELGETSATLSLRDDPSKTITRNYSQEELPSFLRFALNQTREEHIKNLRYYPI